MALVYLGCIVGGYFFLQIPPAEFGEDLDPMEVQIQGYLLMIVGVPFAIFFGAAPFLPKRPWAWIYGIVAIAFGMTSPCCLPASIPLLIFWIKPETKAFFEQATPY